MKRVALALAVFAMGHVGCGSDSARDPVPTNDGGESPPVLDATVEALAPDGGSSDAAARDSATDAAKTDAQVASDASVVAIDNIAVGGVHGCAIRGGAVWCWGNNEHGELGDGTMTPRLRPVQLSHAWPAAPVELALGYYHSCVRLADHSVWCWGSTRDGQVGTAISNTPVLTPTKVPGIAKADEVVAGSYFTCAREGTTLSCFGNNEYGQLGDGTKTRRASPATVSSLPAIQQVSAGGFNVCARTSNSVYCWGASAYGALGEGSLSDRTSPSEVTTLRNTGVQQVSVRGLSTCVRRSGCDVLCWGRSDGSVVGYSAGGDTTPLPKVVAGTGASCSHVSHTCVLGSELRCWAESSGIMGGTTTPMQVGLTSPTAVATGYSSRCAVDAKSDLYCWGRNLDGQVGDGTTTARELPTRVSF